MQQRFYNRLSIAAIIIGLVALCFTIWKVTPCVVDENTYIGIIATLIGVMTTFVIGYQIWNVIDFRDKLSGIETLRDELRKQKSDNENLRIQQEEGFAIILARLYHKNGLDDLNAFISLLNAIPYSLSLPDKKVGYKWLMNELEDYMLHITLVSFGSGAIDVFRNGVAKFRDLIVPIDHKIREHENYLMIKDSYEELMHKFQIRLEGISQGDNVSLTEIDKVEPLMSKY